MNEWIDELKWSGRMDKNNEWMNRWIEMKWKKEWMIRWKEMKWDDEKDK